MTQLHVEGEVQSPQAFGFSELRALSDQIEDVSRLIPGREGSAVRLQTVLEQVGPQETVRYITLESTDGKFSASVPLEAVQEGIIAYRFNDAALPEKKGGPYRFFIPNVAECHVSEVDACANVKFLGRICLSHEKGRDVRPVGPQAHEEHHHKPGHEHLA